MAQCTRSIRIVRIMSGVCAEHNKLREEYLGGGEMA
jgi:hypothetical protein